MKLDDVAFSEPIAGGRQISGRLGAVRKVRAPLRMVGTIRQMSLLSCPVTCRGVSGTNSAAKHSGAPKLGVPLPLGKTQDSARVNEQIRLLDDGFPLYSITHELTGSVGMRSAE